MPQPVWQSKKGIYEMPWLSKPSYGWRGSPSRQAQSQDLKAYMDR